jgi:uncharacterized membrane protein YkoI
MRKYIAIGILTGWSLWAVADDKVDYSQLPKPVQKTLDASKGTDAVKDIEKQVKDGKTVYEVEFERTGLNPTLLIAEDGTVVRDSRKDVATTAVGEPSGTVAGEGMPFPRIATLQLADVPPAVQKTIEQHAAGRKIADIDKETWNKRTVYEVEFTQEGRNAQLHIAEDGTIVKEEPPQKVLERRCLGSISALSLRTLRRQFSKRSSARAKAEKSRTSTWKHALASRCTKSSLNSPDVTLSFI